MIDYMLLLIGESGSGKSTIAAKLCEKYGLRELLSYTDRPKRHKNENGHTFVTPEEADDILFHKKIIAYTEFDGHRYFCTEEQFMNSDIYIIDPAGLSYLIRNYSNQKDVYAIYIKTTENQRVKRMAKRGDDPLNILKRLDNDRIKFADDFTVSSIVSNNWLPLTMCKIRWLLMRYKLNGKLQKYCG